MSHVKKFWKVYAWGILITILSCLPTDNKGSEWINIPHADKIVHALFYGILTALIIFSAAGTFKARPFTLNIFFYSLVLVLIFGSIMEVLQHFLIPTRYGDPADILFNISGWVIAVVALYLRTWLVSKITNH